MRLVILLFVLAGLVYASPIIDPALAGQMAQNSTEKLHVIAFFKERLTPENVVQDHGIRGDELSVTQQVVEIYKNEAQRQLFWFSKQKYASEMEELSVHELIQAVSFKANAKIISEVAKQPEIAEVKLFNVENTKPHSFFLKNSYFEFKIARVTEVGQSTENRATYAPASSSREITPDQIINILKQLWDFIKENQPVVNTSVDIASAVPSGTTNWQELAGWVEKHTGQYVIEYVNGFGITVVKIVVRVHFYHSGNYNGIGRYITCATASIDQLNVLWGYTLNADVKVPNSGIVNIGTHDNPIAGMKMFIHWSVHTIIQHQEGTRTFDLDGKGNISSY